MNRSIRIALALLACFAAISAPAADLPSQLGDGWHTWQVDEASATNATCCFDWQNGKSSRTGCDLDGRSIGFNNSGDWAAEPGNLKVYARIDNGKPVDIRVLSSNCPVSAKGKIADLGLVSAQNNLTWFRNIIEDTSLHKKTREDALFALVMSESEAAYTYLDQLLSRR